MKRFNLIFLILFFSCSGNINHTLVINYLEKDLNCKLSNNEIFLFVHDGVCTTCIKSTSDYLNENNFDVNEKLTVVLIGNSRKQMKYLAQYFSKNVKIIYDSKNLAEKRKIFDSPAEIYIFTVKGRNKDIFNYSINNNFDLMKIKIANFFK